MDHSVVGALPLLANDARAQKRSALGLGEGRGEEGGKERLVHWGCTLGLQKVRRWAVRNTIRGRAWDAGWAVV